MTPTDIPGVTAAILADDWGHRRSWFEFVVDHPQCHVVVADVFGEVVGTGVATVSGSVAWIGTIWVAPAWRGRGVGRALTQAAIDAAEGAGSRTLVLVATQQGQPMYERLGFAVQTWYRTMEARGLAAAEPGGAVASAAASRADAMPAHPRRTLQHRPFVRAYRPADLPAMARLDARATGEDRAHLLAAFASPSSTRVVVGADGRPRGFVVRAPWGGGATIAPDLDDALAILASRRFASGPDRHVRCGILLENEAGAAALEAAGWTEAWRAPRLVRGEPLTWAPEAIWGQFNHALG